MDGAGVDGLAASLARFFGDDEPSLASSSVSSSVSIALSLFLVDARRDAGVLAPFRFVEEAAEVDVEDFVRLGPVAMFFDIDFLSDVCAGEGRCLASVLRFSTSPASVASSRCLAALSAISRIVIGAELL
jgi:hypothetical protein